MNTCVDLRSLAITNLIYQCIKHIGGWEAELNNTRREILRGETADPKAQEPVSILNNGAIC